jgi:hypothetical protein
MELRKKVDRGVDAVKRSRRQYECERNWRVRVRSCAVGDPEHVEKFFDRNLGDLNVARHGADRLAKARAVRRSLSN